jgi:hypothetical protein
MRALIGIIVIIYLVGVGVMLAPTVRGKWNTGTASELSASVMEALPNALAWPAVLYHSLADRGDAATPASETSKP